VDIVSGVMARSTNSWTTIPRSEITITKLTGGLTNILYSVKPLKSVQKNEEPVVIRIFGSGTSEIIDRQTENLIFSRLSQSKFGPPFYGLFENGNYRHFKGKSIV
jgi:thiamine kinase-like enzyme